MEIKPDQTIIEGLDKWLCLGMKTARWRIGALISWKTQTNSVNLMNVNTRSKTCHVITLLFSQEKQNQSYMNHLQSHCHWVDTKCSQSFTCLSCQLLVPIWRLPFLHLRTLQGVPKEVLVYSNTQMGIHWLLHRIQPTRLDPLMKEVWQGPEDDHITNKIQQTV